MKEKENSKIIKMPEDMFDMDRNIDRIAREEIEKNVKSIEDKNVVLQLYKNTFKVVQDINNQMNYDEILYYSRENLKILKQYINEKKLNTYNIDDRVKITKTGKNATIVYVDEEKDQFLLEIDNSREIPIFYSSGEFELLK